MSQNTSSPSKAAPTSRLRTAGRPSAAAGSAARQSIAPPGARASLAPRPSAANVSRKSTSGAAAGASPTSTRPGVKPATAATSKARGPAARATSSVDSPTLESRFTADILDETGDDSGLIDFSQSNLLGPSNGTGDKLSFSDLSLSETTPRVKKSTAATKAKARPSWGPLPTTAASRGKMRLLEGMEEADGSLGRAMSAVVIDDTPATDESSSQQQSSAAAPAAGKKRGIGGMAGGRGKARYSLFAKPSYLQDSAATSSPGGMEPLSSGGVGDESLLANETGMGLGEAGDDSFLGGGAAVPKTGGRGASANVAVAGEDKAAEEVKTPAGQGESQAQVDRQLAELRRLNGVFEAYEDMLKGSAAQIDTFAQRLDETNSLLDIYIDLLRQTDKTQKLLLDGEWQGATEDASAHALSIELAERETRRLKEEAEAAAAAAAAAVAARAEAEAAGRAEEAKRGGAGARGRGGLARGGASVRGTSGIARGRGAAPTASTRTSGIARGRPTTTTTTGSRTTSGGSARGASTSGGLADRYAGVKSSGYGPR